jgi:2-keto-4-pentenoate hydratase/2-oxohepta-3-ene-1,7-dioic acid hydratase in catechol pathway
MKLVRFLDKHKVFWGLNEDGKVTLLKEPPFKRIKLSRAKFALKKIKLLPPAEPNKIVLVGLNYKDHARELGMPSPREPLIFLKPATTLIAHGQAIVYPQGVNRLDYEAELALVIKEECKNVKPKDASRFILGFTCLNDVTARDLQKRDGQWTRSKSFDTFCPLGPWLETELDYEGLNIRSYLNGQLKQNSNTSQFIFKPWQLLSFISRIMTLSPGDIISTGTPSGVGPMAKGDIIEIEIEAIAKLINYVKG